MKRWLEAIFYKPKHEKSTDENILRLFMPSVVGIFICMVCLAGSTWAWFSASIVNTENIIQATTYELEIFVTDLNGTVVEPTNGVYTLAGSQSYTVTLTAADDGASTGYCVIRANDKTYYTASIAKGGSFTFTVYGGGRYTFAPAWGSYDSDGKIVLENGETIGEKTEPAVQPDANQLPNSEQPAENGGPSTEEAVESPPTSSSQPESEPSSSNR